MIITNFFEKTTHSTTRIQYKEESQAFKCGIQIMGYLFCFLNRLNAFFIYNFISVASKTVTKKFKESSYI